LIRTELITYKPLYIKNLKKTSLKVDTGGSLKLTLDTH
jgi:hypothetical protein